MTESPLEITSKAWKVIPFFRSSNIFETISFYKTTLHMKAGPIYPSETDARFVSLSCGPKAAVNIYFQIFHPNEEQHNSPPQRAMVALETLGGVNKLHEHLLKCGMHRKGEPDHEVQKFTTRCDMTEPEDMEWGYRQFTMWDIDGNELTLFAFINSDDD